MILIDGGKNQLKFVQNIINKSPYKDIKVISIVKGVNRIRATETILSLDGVVEMNKNSKAFLLLQEIRDEAHRFAITTQRKKKGKFIKKSYLDDIQGIGPKTKSKLLKKYKSIKSIKSANINDLIQVKGISINLARRIIEK